MLMNVLILSCWSVVISRPMWVTPESCNFGIRSEMKFRIGGRLCRVPRKTMSWVLSLFKMYNLGLWLRLKSVAWELCYFMT